MKPATRNFLILLLLFLCGMVVSNLLLLAAGFFFGPWTAAHYAAWLRISQVVTVVCSFVLPAAYMMQKQEVTFQLLPTADNKPSEYFYSIAAWIGISPLVNLTDQWNHKLTQFTLFGKLELFQSRIESLTKALVDFSTIWEFVAVFLIVALLAAVSEEMFFRGALQNIMLQRFSPVASIIVVALLFSVMHGEMLSFLPRFLLGILFGYIVWKTGTLAITVLLHTINNTIALLATHYDTGFLETYGTGDTWYLSVAGTAIMIWALIKLDCATKNTKTEII